jgi:hypothetical protein
LKIGSLHLELRKAYIAATMLLTFSYATTTVWMLMTGIPTGPGNLLIKAMITGLFLLSLPFTLARMESLLGPLLPVLVLLGLYAVRLLYDVVVRDILMIHQTSTYVLSYFFGLTLLPVIALCGVVRRTEIKQIHNWVFALLAVANVSLLVFALRSGFEDPLEALGGRVQAEGDTAGTAVLGPIGIGLMGACLAAFAIGRLAVFGGFGVRSVVLHVGAIALGCGNILFGASRGPAIAFVLCMLAVAASLVRSALVRKGLRMRQSAWLFLLMPVIVVVALVVRGDIPVFLFARFLTLFEERLAGGGGLEERDVVQRVAWEDFSDSPLFGSSYVVSFENSSPHNMVYDALIAAGVLGAVALAWTLLRMLGALWRAWRGDAGPHAYPLALIGICLFVLQLTSGSIGQTPEFWVFMSLLILLTSPAVPDRSTFRVASAPKVAPPQAPLIGGNASAV